MKRVLDFTGTYKPKDDERVVRGEISLFDGDVRGFDKVVAFEKDKERFVGIDIVVFVKQGGKR